MNLASPIVHKFHIEFPIPEALLAQILNGTKLAGAIAPLTTHELHRINGTF